ncbi:hypothetical protein WA026_015311 [Henosepilachna vigintioctopunctata]|uniref:Uncharacterized protein n=1 Tax=Henosepilachna vigintioctopunctata TaxID=420089 RepID=A0AAW1TUK1_9CUCU
MGESVCSKRQDCIAVFQAPFKLLKIATSMGYNPSDDLEASPSTPIARFCIMPSEKVPESDVPHVSMLSRLFASHHDWANYCAPGMVRFICGHRITSFSQFLKRLSYYDKIKLPLYN